LSFKKFASISSSPEKSQLIAAGIPGNLEADLKQ